MMLKFFAAYLLISAGLTIWLDILRGCTFNADQIVGLTVAFALAGLLIHEIVRSLAARSVQRRSEIDITTLFEEV